MKIRSAVIGFVVVLALVAPAGYALQEFTLEEAQTRIERLEARVASLEAMMPSSDGGTPEASETHTFNGTTALKYAASFEAPALHVGESCTGAGGYNDIRPGATVRVLDEAGNIIGSTQLSVGEVIRLPGRVYGCEFSWTVEVEDADFYVIEIANRAGPTYSRADLEEAGWTVELTIGE
jgi:hypothetical protein